MTVGVEPSIPPQFLPLALRSLDANSSGFSFDVDVPVMYLAVTPSLVVKSPIWLTYFVILAARPFTSSARRAATR